MLFSPSNPSADFILHDLASGHVSLHDIATSHDSTVDAVALWLSTPEISARLDAMESVAARCARIAASTQLPHAVQALSLSLREFSDDTRNATIQPNSDAERHHRRHAVNVRRAAWLLYKLSNFAPGPLLCRLGGRGPAPRGGEGSAFYTISTAEAPQTATITLNEIPTEAPAHSPPGRIAVRGGEGYASSPNFTSQTSTITTNLTTTPNTTSDPSPTSSRSKHPNPADSFQTPITEPDAQHAALSPATHSDVLPDSRPPSPIPPQGDAHRPAPDAFEITLAPVPRFPAAPPRPSAREPALATVPP